MNFVGTLTKLAIDRGGGLRLARFLHRNGLRILMYHRFADAEALARQCSHLKSYYHPLSLTDSAERMSSGRPFPPGAVAVTVDDGYRDFFTVAYPVFSAFRIPVTVFLVTGFLDRSVWLWVDRIQYAFERTRLSQAAIELPSGEILRLPLETPDRRSSAVGQVKEAAKRLRNPDRLELLDRLPALLQVDLPGQPPEGYQPLTWDEVRTMAAGGVEFGAHTRTHPILSSIAADDELRSEINGSKLRIQQELGSPPAHFCYPNGRACDFNRETVDAVREAGFLTAVTTESGLNYPGTDPFRLQRIGVEPGLPEPYFHRCVAGVRL